MPRKCIKVTIPASGSKKPIKVAIYNASALFVLIAAALMSLAVWLTQA